VSREWVLGFERYSALNIFIDSRACVDHLAVSTIKSAYFTLLLSICMAPIHCQVQNLNILHETVSTSLFHMLFLGSSLQLILACFSAGIGSHRIQRITFII
jgi:hypothetical protein